MYRRYVIVGVVFFLLIGAYFAFFDKKEENNDYEKYYKKLVNREEFSSYLDDVNITIKETLQSDSKYTYEIVLGGVTSKKEDIKVLILDDNCKEEIVEFFPSIGIVSDKGYSLVKKGEEDRKNNLFEYARLAISDEEKIDYFIIYFSSNGVEEFARVAVSTFSN